MELLNKSDSKISEVDKLIKKKNKITENNDVKEEPNWSVLSDNFMMGKDWNDEIEVENEFE